MSNQRTVDFGKIMKFQNKETGELGEPILALDQKIQEVKLVVKLWDKEAKKEVLTEVSLTPNDKGGFMIYCNDAIENSEFLLSKEYIDEKRHNSNVDFYERNNVSRTLSVKVE